MQKLVHASTTPAHLVASRTATPARQRLLERVDPGRPYFGRSATPAQIARARAALDRAPARYLPL
jgi:hypothetical protein